MTHDTIPGGRPPGPICNHRHCPTSARPTRHLRRTRRARPLHLGCDLLPLGRKPHATRAGLETHDGLDMAVVAVTEPQSPSVRGLIHVLLEAGAKLLRGQQARRSFSEMALRRAARSSVGCDIGRGPDLAWWKREGKHGFSNRKFWTSCCATRTIASRNGNQHLFREEQYEP